MACPLRAPLFAVRPLEGGIHPREAADHHAEHASKLFQQALEMNDIDSSQIARIAFSQGPGLGPCLRVGASIARGLAHRLNVPLIGVNHCVAHIEVGRTVCEVDDPVLLYVSGGNTQVIARRSGRYRVLGETLDIGIGNMLDKFGRGFGIAFPAGPAIEQHARAWVEDHPDDDMEGVRLPYAVRGMDLAFSGLLTAASAAVASGQPFDRVCWSLQEHAFAACIEVAERALAHTGLTEVLLGGGVACNRRLRQMGDDMTAPRGATCVAPPNGLCVDNGAMIAVLGHIEIESGRRTELIGSGVDPGLRTDATPILWA